MRGGEAGRTGEGCEDGQGEQEGGAGNEEEEGSGEGEEGKEFFEPPGLAGWRERGLDAEDGGEVGDQVGDGLAVIGEEGVEVACVVDEAQGAGGWVAVVFSDLDGGDGLAALVEDEVDEAERFGGGAEVGVLVLIAEGAFVVEGVVDGDVGADGGEDFIGEGEDVAAGEDGGEFAGRGWWRG